MGHDNQAPIGTVSDLCPRRARKAERLAIGTAPSLSKDEVAKRAEAHESNYRRPAFRMGKR